MSSDFVTILFTDSRGKGLVRFIQNYQTPDNIRYFVDVKSGWSLQRFAPRIIEVINRHDIELVYGIVFAGICGLTERTNEGNVSILRYPGASRDTKVNETCDIIRSLKDRFRNHINFATIVPANLPAYFQHHNPGISVPAFLYSEQSGLEADIRSINDIITFINCGTISNINLINWISLKSKKRRQRSGRKVVYRKVVKLTYRDFIDGVHFSEKLKRKFFRLFLHISITDIETKFIQVSP